MSTEKTITGGGLKAVKYVFSCARKAGAREMLAAVRSSNTCKACAFGTGGQRGGLHNEHSNRLEVCNKNIQAQFGDLRKPIPEQVLLATPLVEFQSYSGKQLEDLGRLATPLYKQPGKSHFSTISYADALDLTVRKFATANPNRSFFYASGRSSNEAAFLLQLFARSMGSNHVNNCSYYCHQASGVGLNRTIGTGTATIQYDDLHKADLIFVFGANPASNHPRFVKTLIECRQRGGTVIVVNPAKEAGLVKFASPSNFRSMITGGSEVASLYVQPRIGGDIALIAGIAKAIIEKDKVADEFIAKHCNNYLNYQSFITKLNWPDLEAASGVDKATILQASRLYAAANSTIFAWGMGVTHHQHGTENIEAISNLALLRGMIGGSGKGLLPLRGHSNVQGVGSMGFTPALKSKVFAALETELGLQLPTHNGMDTLACMQAADRGEIDQAFLLGGNLYAATPDATFAARALSNIPFKIMLTSSLNKTHIHGMEQENLILPVRVRDEEVQATTQESMFNFVRLSDGGINRVESLRSETEIILGVAENVINKDKLDFREFRNHSSIRQTIAKIIPGFERMAQLDGSKQEFHINGRHLETPAFPTHDGKANFLLTPSLNANYANMNLANKNEFMLTTVRSEGQFNTIIYTDEDVYRGQKHRQVLFMNPQDIEAQGLREGDEVAIRNETGILRNLKIVSYNIHQGNVMTYFPEANVVIPQNVDPSSSTPAFKSVPISVVAGR